MSQHAHEVQHEHEIDDRFNEPITRAALRVLEALGRRFDISLEHGERIPRKGGAILVGNHTYWGTDAYLLYPHLVRESGRFPRGLGDRVLFHHPIVGRTLGAILRMGGSHPGEPKIAQALLERGHLLLVYPGGAREALKPAEQRYKLRWEGRPGYLRVAAMAQVPVIPILATGIDDLWTPVGYDRWISPLFLEDRIALPLTMGSFGPIPNKVKITYHVQEPIAPPPREIAGDREKLLAVHEKLVGDLQLRLDRLVEEDHA